MHAHTNVFAFKCMFIWKYVWVYNNVDIYTYVCMWAHMSLHVCTSERVYMGL